MTAKAEALNAKWDALVRKFDDYYNSIDSKVRSTINGAISEWQNFYYGETPSDSKLAHWEGVYTKTVETLAAAIPSGAKVESASKSTAQAKKTDADATFYITGKVEPTPIPDVTIPDWAMKGHSLDTPKWLIPAIIGVPAAYILYRWMR